MTWLLLITFIELILGSRDGALFSFSFDGFRVTLRMLLFALTLVWFCFKRKIWPSFGAWIPWAFLGVMVVWGVGSGLLSPNSRAKIYEDANAYFFALLILPILTLTAEDRERLKGLIEKYLPILGVMVALTTIVLTVVFSYGYAEHGGSLYRFVRDLRLGEITPVLPGFTRVFAQSQIWLLPIWFMLLQRLWSTKTFLTSVVVTTALILSLSRSFWIGWIAGVILLLVHTRSHGTVHETAKKVSAAVVTAIAFLVILFPSFPQAFLGRGIPGEPAASTRSAELAPLWGAIAKHPILGSGLGSQVFYKSMDPRHPGLFTTSAFEWGYLDQWLDMGLLGLFAILFLVYDLIKKTRHVRWLAPSLLAVAVTHIASPYLNHPLGLGMLLLAAIYVKNEPTASG